MPLNFDILERDIYLINENDLSQFSVHMFAVQMITRVGNPQQLFPSRFSQVCTDLRF